MNLRSNAGNAFLWSLVERLGSQILRVLFTIVLARLLLPEHFGIIGILTAFLGIAEALVQSGLGLALIREPNPTHLEKCSIFYFGIAVAGSLSALLFLCAPLLVSFYRLPTLIQLTQLMTLGVVLKSLSIVPNALLVKQMAFGTLGKISIVSNILSGIAGIGMARAGFGVWSLVAQQLGGTLLMALLVFISCKWRPTLEFSWFALRRYLSFGASFLVISLLDTFTTNIYFAILGRIVSLADVGLYSRAQQIQELPVKNFYYVISRPSLSIFSSLQQDPAALAGYFRSTVSILAFINFPIMAALAASAEPLTLALLTSNWLGAVPMIRMFCLVGAIYPLQRIVINLLAALGRHHTCLKLEVSRNGLMIISVLLAANAGVMAVIMAQAGAFLVAYLMTARCASLTIGYHVRRQFADLVPYLLSAGFTGLGMYCVSFLELANPILILLAQFAVGATIYGGLATLCPLEGLAELRRIIGSGRVRKIADGDNSGANK